MATESVRREIESRAVSEFLAAVPSGPAALVLEGAAGIGKTTLWQVAVQRAQSAGFQVLSTRATSAGSVVGYTALADLLSPLGSAEFAEMPPPQRRALDGVLSPASDRGAVPDQRAVAAALVWVAERIGARAPVVLAVDDLQWLDAPSRLVFSAAIRRFNAAVGILATVRDEPDHAGAAAWLELRRPERVRHVRIRPLSLGATHTVLVDQLGRSFARPEIRRIHEISGGNPFYALELGRVSDAGTGFADTTLPARLADVVRTRLADVTPECGDALLAAACMTAATLEAIAAAIGTDARTVATILEPAEASGIIRIDGHRVSYAHPFLACGVYADAAPARRRGMHCRLAEVVDDSELKARHLALAAARADAASLRSLDAAAEHAHLRGAPIAAAEFLDRAIELGRDCAARRIRSAAHHYAAGDPGRARSLLEPTIDRLAPGALRNEAIMLLSTIRMSDDSFGEAAALLADALTSTDRNDTVSVRMSVMLAFALFNGGRQEQALQHADEAVANALLLDTPALLGQALGMRATLRFLVGDGVARTDMRRALELAADPPGVPLAARPVMQNALLLAWTGRFDDAAHEMTVIRQRCMDSGEDSELIFLGFHAALLQVWRGDFSEAERIADATTELARQLDGDLPLFVALTVKAMHGSYAGRVDAVRRDVADALAAAQRCGSQRLSEWPITTLGFLEVSLGNHAAALQALAPLLTALAGTPRSTEIVTASFLPDAVEALVGLRRFAEAEPLVSALERNGARLDRAWMLAVGARCRAMLRAAQGDITAAQRAAQDAIAHHDRLAMPFERARTQLMAGDLLRRQRRRDLATATLRDALAAFEDLGAPLWAERARAALNRASGTHTRAGLTASEGRIAELATCGMSNREMAAKLFISPKTVEANLSRIYRKLGIRSRAELGGIVGRVDR